MMELNQEELSDLLNSLSQRIDYLQTQADELELAEAQAPKLLDQIDRLWILHGKLTRAAQRAS